MPKPTLDTLEQRFSLIKDAYQRMDHRNVAGEKLGKINWLLTSIGNVFRDAKKPLALPDRIEYHALKQLGRPTLKPAAFITKVIKESYLITMKQEMRTARGLDRSQDALLLKEAEQMLDPLMAAVATGTLDAWLQFYSTMDRLGLASNLPGNKQPALSFWSGSAPSGRKAADIAKSYSDSGAGARDVDQVAFNATKAAAGAFTGLQKTNTEAYDHIWYELFGLQSSLYATLARGDVICFMPQGVTIDNIFWKNELPILRRLQLVGHVDHIYVYSEGDDPVNAKDASLDATQKRALWFAKSVELTSPSVSMSQRLPDGKFAKLDFSADVFVKWLLSSKRNDLNVLYRWRVISGVYAKLVRGSVGTPSAIEMWKPYIGDHVKRVELVGYDEAGENRRIASMEKYLMANYADWGSVPDRLIMINDAILQAEGARARLKAILTTDGSWIYTEALGTRLKPGVNKSQVDALIDGPANETSSQMDMRITTLRNLLGLPVDRSVVKAPPSMPAPGNVKNLIKKFGG
jgi:hypothetical protein